MDYAILGEHQSDAQTLKVIVKRLSRTIMPAKQADKLSIRPKGYEGWSEMFRNGRKDVSALAELGCRRFIVCFDSDGHDPGVRKKKIMNEIIRPSGVKKPVCALVPVEEIEAWILADISAVAKILKSWRPFKEIVNPEKISSPKERLKKLCRDRKTRKERYQKTIHNEKVAEYLDLDVLHKKCASFRFLSDFVKNK